MSNSFFNLEKENFRKIIVINKPVRDVVLKHHE